MNLEAAVADAGFLNTPIALVLPSRKALTGLVSFFPLCTVGSSTSLPSMLKLALFTCPISFRVEGRHAAEDDRERLRDAGGYVNLEHPVKQPYEYNRERPCHGALDYFSFLFAFVHLVAPFCTHFAQVEVAFSGLLTHATFSCWSRWFQDIAPITSTEMLKSFHLWLLWLNVDCEGLFLDPEI